MNEQDLIDLLELQRITRGLLDHLTAMFSWRRRRSCGVTVARSVRQLKRRILRTRGEAGALLRHVALDVGEDGFELGLVADRGEVRVEVAVVAPSWPRQPAFSASRSAASALPLSPRRAWIRTSAMPKPEKPSRGQVANESSLRSSSARADSSSPVFWRTSARSIAMKQFEPSIVGRSVCEKLRVALA